MPKLDKSKKYFFLQLLKKNLVAAMVPRPSSYDEDFDFVTSTAIFIAVSINV